MRIFKTVMGILVEHEAHLYTSEQKDWDAYINRDDLYAAILKEISGLQPAWTEDWAAVPASQAPIGSQEVWAAGVTYKRSKAARMEESKESGAATFYDMVYEAERPEL